MVQQTQPLSSSAKLLACRLDQQMVEADFAEFVDDDHRSRQIGLTQKVIQHRRLAAAEKAGDDGNGDRGV